MSATQPTPRLRGGDTGISVDGDRTMIVASAISGITGTGVDILAAADRTTVSLSTIEAGVAVADAGTNTINLNNQI